MFHDELLPVTDLHAYLRVGKKAEIYVAFSRFMTLPEQSSSSCACTQALIDVTSARVRSPRTKHGQQSIEADEPI